MKFSCVVLVIFVAGIAHAGSLRRNNTPQSASIGLEKQISGILITIEALSKNLALLEAQGVDQNNSGGIQRKIDALKVRLQTLQGIQSNLNSGNNGDAEEEKKSNDDNDSNSQNDEDKSQSNKDQNNDDDNINSNDNNNSQNTTNADNGNGNDVSNEGDDATIISALNALKTKQALLEASGASSIQLAAIRAKIELLKAKLEAQSAQNSGDDKHSTDRIDE